MTKWILITVLVLSVAVLGCTPNDTPTPDTNQETAEEPSFEDAMSTNVQTGEWLTDFNKAMTIAKESKLPVLINFTGSDWCSWCIKLDGEVFSKDAFKNYAKENLVLLKLDFPRKIQQTPELKAANEKKAQEYGITGFPSIVLVDHTGKELNRTGYQPGGADAYVAHLQKLISNPKK